MELLSVNNASLSIDKGTSSKQIKKVANFKSVIETEKARLLTKQKAKPIDKELMNVCYEFESIFVNRMFKAMYKTINKKNSLMHGGQAEEIFNDMLYEKHALNTSKKANLGLAKAIYDQLASVKRYDKV